MTRRRAVVYGATGHTGRMVAAALHEREWSLALSARSRARLDGLATTLDAEVRAASIDSPAELDAAISGADIVVNCAGPFRDTAPALIAAALRARIPYLDVAAEIEANVDVIENWDAPAREAGVAVVPAMGFYGGLCALVAAEALGSWRDADRVVLSYGLNEWIPTAGTIAAGAVSRERRGAGMRPVYTNGALAYTDRPAATVEWEFPAPLGRQPAIAEMTMIDTVVIGRHATVGEIVSYMPAQAVAGLSAGAVRPTDSTGESPSRQRFVVQAVATRNGERRSCTVRGGDIYAITAPLVAEAAAIVIGSGRAGVLTAPELAPPGVLLRSLQPYLDIEE